MTLQRPSLESILTRAWMRRGLLACTLWPVSLLFHGVVALRRRLYAVSVLKSTRLPVPVIVVGNIFLGGTGKTPLTIWLVDALRRAGYVPGVISRGYGAHNDVPQPVSAGSLPQQVGDEPVLIATRAQCPVMVGRNRVAAATALLAAHPEVNLIVSDDGLQHYALARDVEIVLCDARGNGNGWLLPAGPLREPASRPRDFTVVNGAHRPHDIPHSTIFMRLVGDVAERLVDRSQRVALHSLPTLRGDGRPARIVAAAGIGNPARFFAMLRNAGVIFEEMPLADHYDFDVNPFAESSADMILITEKDAVKCIHHGALKNDERLWVVPVAARIDAAFAEQIVEKCRG
ncbi:tetraacyldisaccharide 4'-kinase [Noviherbaspirillum cavernae]|uniref:Tetraacyldisaccharide 4'-kinase n=1 Tax=Noviherbaspirillum cavernae TaxID=2320862 RepID=A0A418X2T6_9BURK|nr:tetraacyldisaccharide 4'-kinase [Noviherbaspirillum cavernae]RJG06773.1 tetraacyldisaccharide 4'-kinase [Noviherbaspirillum cavernae]